MNTYFMDTVLYPLLAIFGILVPLGVAYVILFMYARKPDSSGSRKSSIARNDLLQKRTESRAAKRYGSR